MERAESIIFGIKQTLAALAIVGIAGYTVANSAGVKSYREQAAREKRNEILMTRAIVAAEDTTEAPKRAIKKNMHRNEPTTPVTQQPSSTPTVAEQSDGGAVRV